MGDKYYGHTISGNISSIEIEPSARSSNKNLLLHPVNKASDSIKSISDEGREVKYSIVQKENAGIAIYNKNTMQDRRQLLSMMKFWKLLKNRKAESEK